MRKGVLFLCVLFFSMLGAACGEETEEDEGAESPTIVIGEGNSFATTEVTATSGATITIINNDGDPHAITSESAEEAFDNTGDFDTLVPADGMALLTLSDYPSGTVLFYYCRLHTSMMSPSDGRIVIE